MGQVAKKQELAKVGPAQLPAAVALDSSEVVAKDVLIPRLILMQGISPLVSARKAQIGDMVRSTTGEKLGDPEHSIPIVPLMMQSVWVEYEKVPGINQPQWRGMYPRGITQRSDTGQALATNADLPWDFKGPTGQVMMRKQGIILFALVPSDIAANEAEIKKAIESGEAPDLSKGIMPVVITMQGTSFKFGGKQIATFFNNIKKTNADMAGKLVVKPWDYVMDLGAREEKKGTNAWYVNTFDAPKALHKVFTDKAVRQSILEKAQYWAQSLGAGAVQIDGGEDAEDESAPATSVSEMDV